MPLSSYDPQAKALLARMTLEEKIGQMTQPEQNELKDPADVENYFVGSLLSGSFAVEIITSWPGLGRLMLDALRARDVYLVAGCAAAGSVFLAAGTLLSDAALAVVDPRSTE